VAELPEKTKKCFNKEKLFLHEDLLAARSTSALQKEKEGNFCLLQPAAVLDMERKASGRRRRRINAYDKILKASSALIIQFMNTNFQITDARHCVPNSVKNCSLCWVLLSSYGIHSKFTCLQP
jgi:hypothetical protein